MDEVTQARVMDPGRGAFCALDKKGELLPAPPVQREPLVVKGRGAVKHPDKTWQDSLPVKDRPRYQAWLKRQGK